QRLGVADALDAGKLQNHKSLVQPMRLELQLAPFAALIESEQHLPLGELLGEIGVQLGGHLSLASLGLHDAGDGDEFGGRGHRVDFGYSSSTMSSEYRFFSFMPAALSSVRIERAVRPCLPITFPTSLGATRNSNSVPSPSSPSTTCTETCEGSSTSA